MIKNLLRIAVLITCTVFATHALAFGGLLEKLNDAIVGGIVGATNPDIASPPQKDRLLNVVDSTKLKTTNTEKPILGSKAYKLAIVKSVNVDEQIKAYQAHVDRRSKGIKDYASNPQPFLDEVNSFVPGNLYFDKAVDLIKAKFNGVINASNVQEAFDQGADYVAIIDLKLENTDLSSKTEPGPLTDRNVADLSALFIGKNFDASPDIVVKNTTQETYQPNGADKNIRASLDILKRARDKTFNEFEAKLNKLVIAELDDPPVLGVRLELTGDSDGAMPKPKLKKKK
jgi:hypothetical protein